MPQLVSPDVRYRASFLAAMAEFVDEGRAGDGSMVGDDLATYAGRWETPEGFAGFVADTRATVGTARPGLVPCTSLWWVEGEEYVGRVAVRHRLDEALPGLTHVGYDVRRSRRREGHATAMLAAALPVAAGLGIDPALLTCDLHNVASRRTIERNGGVLDGVRHGRLRFWVPTRPV